MRFLKYFEVLPTRIILKKTAEDETRLPLVSQIVPLCSGATMGTLNSSWKEKSQDSGK